MIFLFSELLCQFLIEMAASMVIQWNNKFCGRFYNFHESCLDSQIVRCKTETDWKEKKAQLNCCLTWLFNFISQTNDNLYKL